ncbi:3-hydroxyacyl-CoA dehydrogenase family protein [Streptomyces sp. NPDC059785]|uniref:3-hydroxyacyl-CoA dehydrogenase family protein n=1 Tax=Streptomyces sp. NPDC059785 TaxID=3346945 RepID=UPI00366339BC
MNARASAATVGIVGLGTIGTALARRLVDAGHPVLVKEVRPEAAERLHRIFDGSGADRGRIRLVADWAGLAPADVVVEAVPERRETKVEVLRALDRVCPPGTVLVSSAAALSLTDLAAASGRPGRLVGLHLALPTAGLAEIGRTVMTDDTALDAVCALADGIGLRRVTVGDRAGLISTALLFGFLNQAVDMYDQRFAGRDDIDAAMRYGCGLPLGPLQLLDLIGTDTACDILGVLSARWSEPALQPARRLRHMALAGLLGRKSGRGFYDYRETPDLAAAPARTAPDAAPLRTVGIVGTGTMATGIAEVLVKGGFPTVLVGRTDARAKAARDAVAASTARAVRRGKLTEEERAAALERLVPSGDLVQLADRDLVIEAIAEDLDVKKPLFRRLGELCRPGALLATTTSSLPVIECGLASGRPEDVIGLHFFNPAPLMRLVEVIPSLETSAHHTGTARQLCLRLGKHPVQCADHPGFIVNALLFPYLNGAVRLTESHYATADEIDDVMKLGCGYPLGPFELLDIIGLDISLSIQRVLHDADRQPRSVPAPLLGHLVAAGRAGRKSGAGFRVYG